MGNTPMRADNSRHLVAAAQRRSDQTLARAQQALRELQTADQRRGCGCPRRRISSLALHPARTPPADHRPAPCHPARPATGRTHASLGGLATTAAHLAHQRIRELADQNQQLRAAKIGTATRVADTVQHAERRETPCGVPKLDRGFDQVFSDRLSLRVGTH